MGSLGISRLARSGTESQNSISRNNVIVESPRRRPTSAWVVDRQQGCSPEGRVQVHLRPCAKRSAKSGALQPRLPVLNQVPLVVGETGDTECGLGYWPRGVPVSQPRLSSLLNSFCISLPFPFFSSDRWFTQYHSLISSAPPPRALQYYVYGACTTFPHPQNTPVSAR